MTSEERERLTKRLDTLRIPSVTGYVLEKSITGEDELLVGVSGPDMDLSDDVLAEIMPVLKELFPDMAIEANWTRDDWGSVPSGTGATWIIGFKPRRPQGGA